MKRPEQTKGYVKPSIVGFLAITETSHAIRQARLAVRYLLDHRVFPESSDRNEHQ
jgi:hypothetical protein